jgi:sugar lactone lactonase YvrE
MQTRRTFLQQLALSAAGSAVLPSFYLRGSDKTGTRLPVVGSGQFAYECVHDWLLPPEGLRWGDTHSVCQDANGNIYVCHTVNPKSPRSETVVVYDSAGQYQRAFGAEFRGGAHGLDLRREPDGEFLYHCDTTHAVTAKTTLAGEVVWKEGYPTQDPLYPKPAIKYRPTNMAFAANGDYYVADGYGSSHIMRYSRDGKFIQEIGHGVAGEGSIDAPDGQLTTPHGLWVDERMTPARLVVADRSNRRIQVFTLDGRHLRTVKDPVKMRRPCTFHTQGDWMVCPDLDSQVFILDQDYSVVAQLGDGQAHNGKVGSRRTQTRDQFTPGEFICPHDAMFLANGDILVSEWLPIGRITLLRRLA